MTKRELKSMPPVPSKCENCCNPPLNELRYCPECQCYLCEECWGTRNDDVICKECLKGGVRWR